MPSHLPGHVRARLEPIRLLVLDVDGVLTDGTLFYSSSGEETKAFSVRDGLAIRLLLEAGIQVAVLTGRSSETVTNRMSELGVREDLVVQGSGDKANDLAGLMQLLELRHDEVAAMGDDLPDLPMLVRVGFAACPADAAPEVAAGCHLVCRADGGRGAVREVAELILKAQRRWQNAVSRWIDRPGPAADLDGS
jgi:3-deoxy-D-manno-octulosonate 8-phosphate phosphatase (KDO 8-P phosphatase)